MSEIADIPPDPGSTTEALHRKARLDTAKFNDALKTTDRLMGWVDPPDAGAELTRHRAFVQALVDRLNICPVCSYLWQECECGVGADILAK